MFIPCMILTKRKRKESQRNEKTLLNPTKGSTSLVSVAVSSEQQFFLLSTGGLWWFQVLLILELAGRGRLFSFIMEISKDSISMDATSASESLEAWFNLLYVPGVFRENWDTAGKLLAFLFIWSNMVSSVTMILLSPVWRPCFPVVFFGNH